MPDIIKSQISGQFVGFNQDEIFLLVNGQVWQQAEYRYLYYYAYRPKITIYERNGIYIMKVEGIKDPIPVKRLS